MYLGMVCGEYFPEIFPQIGNSRENIVNFFFRSWIIITIDGIKNNKTCQSFLIKLNSPMFPVVGNLLGNIPGKVSQILNSQERYSLLLKLDIKSRGWYHCAHP